MNQAVAEREQIQEHPSHVQEQEQPEPGPPLSVEDLLKKFYDLKEQESSMNRALQALKAERDAVKRLLLEFMDQTGQSMCGFGKFRAHKNPKTHPQVKDWDAFYDFLYKNNAMHLLQRRVSSTAVNEWVANLGDIPGIEFFEEMDLAISRS